MVNFKHDHQQRKPLVAPRIFGRRRRHGRRRFVSRRAARRGGHGRSQAQRAVPHVRRYARGNRLLRQHVSARRRRTWTRLPNPACASTGITASSRSAIRRAPRCSPGAIRPRRACLATARIFASRIPIGRRCRNCSRTTATSPCAPEKFITAALTTPNRGARPATRAARPTTAAARRLAKPW